MKIDYSIDKVKDNLLYVFTDTEVCLYVARILKQSVIAEFLSVFTGSWETVRIEIKDSVISQDCLFKYVEQSLETLRHLENCYKYKMEDRI